MQRLSEETKLLVLWDTSHILIQHLTNYRIHSFIKSEVCRHPNAKNYLKFNIIFNCGDTQWFSLFPFLFIYFFPFKVSSGFLLGERENIVREHMPIWQIRKKLIQLANTNNTNRDRIIFRMTWQLTWYIDATSWLIFLLKNIRDQVNLRFSQKIN